MGDDDPKYITYKPSNSPDILFQPQWYYSYAQQRYLPQPHTDAGRITGSFHFWLSAWDGMKPDADFLEHPHAPGYDVYETRLDVVEGKPFVFSGKLATDYKMGQRVRLTWDVDSNLFDSDSRVRILLSDDFGQTYKYLLKASAPNNGSCEVILPHVTIGTADRDLYPKGVRAGVIKIEEIGGIVYAVSRTAPVTDYDNDVQVVDGGFRINTGSITFRGTPQRYVEVEDEEHLPAVADVTAWQGSTKLEVAYQQTYDADSHSYSRVWKAVTSTGEQSEFEQIIMVNDPQADITTVYEDPQDAPRIRVVDGGVAVSDAAGKIVCVYGIMGAVVRQIVPEDQDRFIINLPVGMYVVNAGRTSVKVMVR